MKFHPFNPNMIYTASIDGTVKKQDFEGKTGQVYLDTLNRDKWFTALNVSGNHRVMSIGNNSGDLILKDFDGNSIWSKRVHKSKCHDIDFHPSDDHLFVSAGHDGVGCDISMFDDIACQIMGSADA